MIKEQLKKMGWNNIGVSEKTILIIGLLTPLFWIISYIYYTLNENEEEFINKFSCILAFILGIVHSISYVIAILTTIITLTGV